MFPQYSLENDQNMVISHFKCSIFDICQGSVQFSFKFSKTALLSHRRSLFLRGNVIWVNSMIMMAWLPRRNADRLDEPVCDCFSYHTILLAIYLTQFFFIEINSSKVMWMSVTAAWTLWTSSTTTVSTLCLRVSCPRPISASSK